MIERSDAVKRIKAALKRKTGKTWSVAGSYGTAYGWIDVQAPKSRRVCYEPIPGKENEPLVRDRIREVAPQEGQEGWGTPRSECAEIAAAFGLTSPVHDQGLSIAPEDRERYVKMVEA